MSDSSNTSSPGWLDQLGGFFGGLFGGDDSGSSPGSNASPSPSSNASPSDVTSIGGTPTTFGFNNVGTGSFVPSGSSPIPINFTPSSLDQLSTGVSADPTSATSSLTDANSGAQSAAAAAPTDPTNQKSTTQSILASLGLGNVTDGEALKGLVAGGGLAYNLIEGSPSSSAEKSLKSIAGQQSAQGQQLESYITNGTLPPGAQQWVDSQTAAQKAAIRGKYAQLGMTGSTAETQELNGVDQQASAQMFTLASDLLNTGVNETNASGTLYNYLMNAENADQKDVTSAIQNFVSSLGGGGSSNGVNINLGKS